MIRLVKTCGACPEQYNAFLDGEYIGYLRLRHGFFRAEYKGTLVYTAHTRGDGCFDEEERNGHLQLACTAILEAYYKGTQAVKRNYFIDNGNQVEM